jgi:hypothetical protein
VLASYNVLAPVMSEKEWKRVIRYALIERTQEKQRVFMKLFLRLDPNPFARIVRLSKTKQVKHYGKQHFAHEIVKDTASEYVLKVHKCFYHSFFTANGASELTKLFCGLDAVWGDLLLPEERYGIRFTRPEVLSAGDAACHFEFLKLKEK